jgi:glycosyltransferase involved in cell wall biosynthesis
MPEEELLTVKRETTRDAGAAKPIPQLSAMMPAYNEEAALPAVLGEAVEALEEQCDSWELVMVDDGSTDRTPEILREWSGRDPRVRIVTQETNQGYSKALARGFDSCRYEAIFYTDADAQFDLREIVRLHPYLAEVDMVTGYRVGRQDPPVRHLTSAVYNRLQGWLLGIRVRDVNCAFKLFRKSFFEKVRLKSDGFLVDAELYARAKRAGLTWKQVGVRHRPRELGSTTVRVSTITETLRELWELRRTLRRES